MKRNLYTIPLALLVLSLASCGGKAPQGSEKFNSIVKDSEQSFIKFEESTEIKDKNMGNPIYSKYTSFDITRSKQIWTEVDMKELRLADDGSGLNATNRHYKTFGEKVIETIDGKDFESTKPVPTYFLTFNPNLDYFNEGYTLTDDGSNMSLSGTIKPDSISPFFLNKSFAEVKNLNVNIDIKENRLSSFKASYLTKHGNDAKISVSYIYPVEVSGPDYVEAIFHLEDGFSGDSKNDVKFAYDFNGRYESHIYDPNELKENNITKPGYHIEGWYRNKNVVDGEVVYENKFDFDHDTMDRKGIELYANWQKNITYTYGVYYKDEKGEHKLGEYKVKAGDTFADHRKLCNKVEGHTSLGYLDENGNEWNKRFTHPGGKDDLEIKVYLDLIEGEYKIVNNFNDLKASKTKNIYLNNDIDCANKDLSFKSYKGTILGNDHKIYNLRIQYNGGISGLEKKIGSDDTTKNHLYISLFRKLENASISNVSFENITVDVNTTFSRITNIVISPFITEMVNSKVKNVSFSGSVTVSKLPANAVVTVVNTEASHVKTSSTIDNFNIDVKYKNLVK